jgi:hypothetical protein
MHACRVYQGVILQQAPTGVAFVVLDPMQLTVRAALHALPIRTQTSLQTSVKSAVQELFPREMQESAHHAKVETMPII